MQGPSPEVARAMSRPLLSAAICLFLAAPAAAEVVDSAAGGFTSRTVVTIDAPPARVYEAFTAEIVRWWDPAHTWTGDAANLRLDPRAGGIFGEDLPEGGSVEHLRVLYADPGKLLRMGGGLGPLQGMAVAGALTVELAPREDGSTMLTLTYAVTGYSPAGLADLAGPVDGVLTGQIERLARYLAP
jgi:uncharacterized protein YndB with AHSA1/START domain